MKLREKKKKEICRPLSESQVHFTWSQSTPSATSPEALTVPAPRCPAGLRTCRRGASPVSRPPHTQSSLPVELPVPLATCSSFKTLLKRHLLPAGTGLPRTLPIPSGSLSTVQTPKAELAHSPRNSACTHTVLH